MASGTLFGIVVVLLGNIYLVSGQQYDVNQRLDQLETTLAKQFKLLNARIESLDARFESLDVRLESFDAQLKSLQLQLTKLTQEGERNAIVREVISAMNRGHFRFVEENLLKMGDRAPISDIVFQVYAGSESNFGLLFNLTQSLTNVAPTCQILSTLYAEMKKNDHLKDIKNLVTLGKALQICRGNDSDANLDALKHIEDDIDEAVASAASDFLIAAMESKKNYRHNKGVAAVSAILGDYRPKIAAAVMERTVEGAFKTVDHEKILKAVNSHSNLWLKIAGINTFFPLLQAAELPLQGSIVTTLAWHLSEIQKQPEYATLDSEMQNTTEVLIANLPRCIRNLFFLPAFCIYNEFQDSYLATTTDVYDAQRRYVFTDCNSLNATRKNGISWRVKMINNKLFLGNIDFPGEYIYVDDMTYDDSTHYVFSSIPNKSWQSEWQIELDGENCYLKNIQIEHYLFASDVWITDENYNLALMMRKEDAEDFSPFIWQIKEC